MISLNQDDMEEVFFDYYEGNLSEDDKAKLFSFLDENPLLCQDFTLWKDAYVHDALPVTDHLENSLVRDEKAAYHFNKSLAYKLIAFLGVCSLCWFISNTYLDKKSKDSVEPIVKLEESQKLDFPKKKSKIKANKASIIITKASQTDSLVASMSTREMTKPDTIFSHSDMGEKVTTRIAPIAMSDTVALDKEAFSNQDQNSIKTATTPTSSLSKKELRKINKAKEKAKILRQEQEFLKGDKPYVVPIDPMRF